MIVADHGRGFSPIEPMPSGSPSTGIGLPGIGQRLTVVPGAPDADKGLSKRCTHIWRPL